MKTKNNDDIERFSFMKEFEDDKIKRLEILSDRVRNGIPILEHEVYEVIEYQEQLKANKKANKKNI